MKKIWVSILILGLLSAGIIGGGLTRSERNCRVCLMHFDHQQISFFEVPVWSWESRIEPSEDTRDVFEEYLDYPHLHEWTGGGCIEWRLGGHRHGDAPYGPYPKHQLLLSKMGLALLSRSDLQRAEERRSYYEGIVQNEDYGHFQSVLQAYTELFP